VEAVNAGTTTPVSKRGQGAKSTNGDSALVVRALAKGLSILALFDAENREWALDEAKGGVAFDLEERNLGTCAVVAPVRDQVGKVIAAISVVAPTGRFDVVGPLAVSK
jgi:hypothetical protein